MKIVYVHHAERNLDEEVSKNEQEITSSGEIQADRVGKALVEYKDKVKGIITSSHRRCLHTSEIINEYFKVKITIDDNFREFAKGETWEKFQVRNMNGLDTIISGFSMDDVIICVSSGVNLSAFIFHNLNIKPSNDNKWIEHNLSAPIIFNY